MATDGVDLLERTPPLQLGDAGNGNVDLPRPHVADGDGSEHRTTEEARRAWLNGLGHYPVEGATLFVEHSPHQVRTVGKEALASQWRGTVSRAAADSLVRYVLDNERLGFSVN